MNNKGSDKNVANIEDDVKLVKRYLENSAYKETDSDFFKNGGWEMVDLEIPKAIEKLLQDYTRQKQINEEHQKINGELREKVKELEKESKILEFQNKQIENYAEELKKYNKTVSDRIVEYKKNSIPKQAVIDKINEYDKKMEEDAGHPYWVVTDRIVMNVLQELLEGGK